MSAHLAGLEPGAPSPLSLTRPTGRRRTADSVATALVYGAFGAALVPLAWILYTVLRLGLHLLLTADWWTHSQRGMTVRTEGGGAYHAVLGTLEIALLCAAISVPIGVMTAVYLVEYGRGRFARLVSFMVDILTGIPSIVAALFIYAVWVTTLGLERVGFAVSLALMLLMMPVIVRSTEEMLKLVPNELREASYALGVPTWKTIVRIVLPTAFAGILTGVMLGLARVMGETAPLLILAPYTKEINPNLFGGYLPALPTMINQDYTQSLPPAVDRTWSAALTLILLVMVLNLAARLVGRFSGLRR